MADENNVKTQNNKRKAIKTAAVILAAVIVFAAGFLGGAGTSGSRGYYSKNGMPSDTGSEPSYSFGTSEGNGYGWDGRYYSETEDRDAPSADVPDDTNKNAGSSGEDITTALRTGMLNTKLIYSASMSLQSTEFEKTCEFIRSMAERYFAYIESEIVDNGNGTAAYRRSASYTVRVPAEHYNSFISGMSEACHVVSLNQKMTDVSEQYFDTEQKLETLKNKHDRLEALLAKAEKMEDIIALEDALSQTEYEMNQYQGSLNKYDSLVSYSTVKISLKEVSRPDTGIDEQPGFFQRLGRSFSEGFSNSLNGLESIAYWLSYNIVVLIVLAAVIVAVVKIHPVRKIKAAREKKNG